MKRFLKLFLCLAMVFTMLPLGKLQAAEAIEYEKSMTVYLSSTGSSDLRWDSLSIFGAGASAVKSVKSSNTSVLEVASSTGSKVSYSEVDYMDGGKESSRVSEYAYINFIPKKAGTSTISFKVGKKTYKTKVTVKKYTNPVASVTMEGVNKGKDFSSKSKKAAFGITAKITTSKDLSKLKVKAAKGWELTNIHYSVEESFESISVRCSSGCTSKTVYLGPVKKGKRAYLSLNFRNTSTNGVQDVTIGLE